MCLRMKIINYPYAPPAIIRLLNDSLDMFQEIRVPAEIADDYHQKFIRGFIIDKCIFISLDVKLEFSVIQAEDGKSRAAAIRMCLWIIVKEVAPFVVDIVGLTNPMLNTRIWGAKLRYVENFD